MRSAKGAVVLAVLVAVAAGAWAQEAGEKKMPEQKESTPVLLVIDIQYFYFEGGFMALEEPVAASKRTREILDRFRARGWPVVHIQHLPKGQEEPDPSGVEPAHYRIHADVLPVAGEKVVGKHHANSFRDTDLLDVLRGYGAKELVITGMQTHMCVEAATRAAADLGFEVTLVHDACATRELEFGGEKVPASQVHRAALAAMDGSYARIVSTQELLSELQ